MARVLYANHSYPSHLKLVCLKADWQICFQANGTLDGRRIRAWLRKVDAQFVCEVGKECQVENMPEFERLNFFGDRYHLSIDETDDAGKRTKSLAGADNIHAARAAFDALVPQYAGRRIILREGARILLVAKGGKIEG
ncbi:hypothetical protein IB262_31705 [Ensifer sp. ENS02]|uniref:hypothetical protein n=1 Tax=Ensifer sp. ENS02 TaxID=2769290 RepID=UPI001780F3AC|nr:hypothetical protein [Ensifer sp. ENS02]MBD9524452.1 hypothetical protein [Ensifer sp. ENS02]